MKEAPRMTGHSENAATTTRGNSQHLLNDGKRASRPPNTAAPSNRVKECVMRTFHVSFR